MNTSEKLLSMLRERTSMSYLDSGGAYGRHWQRNRKKDLEHEPELVMKFSKNPDGKLSTDATVSVYHLLKSQLHHGHLERCLERKLNKAIAQQDEDLDYYEAVDAALKQLGNKGYGLREWISTYGSEAPLSQPFQYLNARIGRHWVWLIMAHNGCDIRGGWTDAHVFTGQLNPYPRIVATGGRRGAVKGQYLLDGTMVQQTRYYEWESENGGYTWIAQWPESREAQVACGLSEIDVTDDPQEVPEQNHCDMVLIEESLFHDQSDKMFCPMTGALMTFQIT